MRARRTIMTITTVTMAIMVTGIGATASASGMASDQAQDWAKKWERQMRKNTHHARTHAALLRTRVPGSLRTAAQPAKLGEASHSELDWLSYGRACKSRAQSATRYVRQTWKRIAHPRHVVSAATWVPLLRHEGWPASAIPTAVQVIRRESGGSPTSWNRSTDCRGLFQIMARYYPGYSLFDPVVNVQVALRMYKDRGWAPWSL